MYMINVDWPESTFTNVTISQNSVLTGVVSLLRSNLSIYKSVIEKNTMSSSSATNAGITSLISTLKIDDCDFKS